MTFKFTLKKLRLLSVGCALFLCFSTSANAAVINWTANLDGLQEVPPSGSSATGLGAGTLDTTSGLLSWDISWTGFTATGMHFHGPALSVQNAGVQVDIGAISGLTSSSIGSTTITAPQVADLQTGLWYINIHSAMFPGGEIRGQVNVVSIPTAAWLFGSGLVGLIGVARRKKS